MGKAAKTASHAMDDDSEQGVMDMIRIRVNWQDYPSRMLSMNRREMMALSASMAFCPFGRSEPQKDLRPLKTLNDKDFFLRAPKTLSEWTTRRERLKEQLLVATGLWPMPEAPPLNAVIHSPIEREHYTISKVYFVSRPGHYVTGSLYQPKREGKRPGVLYAHGHWARGRFQVNSDAEVRKFLESKAEATKESAKYHLQAACASLANRGYVVFQYDMVGYADSTAIGHVARSGVPHEQGFADAAGDLRLQSLMGLQTLNSLRAVDFLLSLPCVDPVKIGMTGASGGGTQTFMAAALDERIKAAVPAVMVSTAMQGGCVCENCSLLRVGTGNVEIAAMIAPRPLALTCADDWTKEFLTKGFPDLQKVYDLYGKHENVSARAWLSYPHNYNQPAREYMASWFAKHLEGKDEDVREQPFMPVPVEELKVFDGKHQRPQDELNVTKLRERMTAVDDKAIAGLSNDPQSKNNFRSVLGTALRAMICDVPPKKVVLRNGPRESKVDGITLHRAWFGREDESDSLPALGSFGPKYNGDKAVLWIHPEGKECIFRDGKAVPAARLLFDAGYAVVSADLYGTGDLKLPKPFEVNNTYAGFTFGYNRTLLAQRIHDILTLMTFATSMLKPKILDMIGWDSAGPWAALARSAAATLTAPAGIEDLRGPIRRGVFDLNQFDFASITKEDDEMMLPGALKYRGLPGLMGVAIPDIAAVHNSPAGFDQITNGLYRTWGVPNAFTFDTKPWTTQAAVEWLLK